MVNYPRISIITPSFNLGKYLEQTILSILNQNYPNLEYIIIDGGSNDESVSIIKKYEKYISYWISEPDGGLYDALQKGFEKSTGDIMGWINADDMYHSGALFTVAEIFKKFDAVKWITGYPTTFDSAGKIINVRPSYFKIWSKYMYFMGEYKWIQQESIFWRRELWKDAGGYINIKYKFASDLDLWLRFFKCTQLYSIQALIGGYRTRHDQMSRIFAEEYKKEATKILKSINFSKKELDRIKYIKFIYRIKKLLRLLKIDFLSEYYYDLLEIPPTILYDLNKGSFILKENKDYFYYHT